ncbi:hypothetical protein JCGZ_04710 [Jatropha curcas]|uniref:Uncharacterized protein n=1 Tax=Jatropha curcas TaxID=180498 RepID=A0A067KPJ4_JATCU|nr:hypothetical protein JCGZ_04710 [Jatropha curcas]
MTVHKGGIVSSSSRNGGPGRVRAAIVVFLLWVILVAAQLGFFYAVHEETGKLVIIKSLPRKLKLLEIQSKTTSFHVPSPNPVVKSSSSLSTKDADGDLTYENDKRIIHTGPNPLHN